jgi:membrane protease YdiL (CAAX protease family)
MAETGLARPAVYLGCAVYWILVNSVLEEYVWRWFVVRQGEALVGPDRAVVLSAAGFTLHHILAMSLYLGPAATSLASAGIFAAGCAWSWCYVRYRSIWPGYLSHALADVAIFAVGWKLIFGG